MYEVLRCIVVSNRKPEEGDGERQAKRICSAAKRSGALATDILDGGDCLYCNVLWPTEAAWLKFKKEQRLRKKNRRELWTVQRHF